MQHRFDALVIQYLQLPPDPHLMPFLCLEHIFVLAAAMLVPSFAGPKAKAAEKASLCKRLQLSNESLVMLGANCIEQSVVSLFIEPSKIHLPVANLISNLS